MPQKTKQRTSEELQKIKAVDTSERNIKYQEYIKVYCENCNCIGEIRLGNAISNLKKKGYGYCCKKCVKERLSFLASQRTGNKNAFFGKKHSYESKLKIKEKKQEFYKNVSQEDKNKHAELMRAAAILKYGKNPMKIKHIKQKHYESTHTKEFLDNAKSRGHSLAQNNNFSDKMSKYSKQGWSTEDGKKRKEKQRQFYVSEFNNPSGKFYYKRLLSLRKAMEKVFSSKEKRFFLRNWVLKNLNKVFKFSSKAEIEILNWINQELSISGSKKRFFDEKTNKDLEIDIFIPSINVGIEYNGLYWHSELYKSKNYHINKTNFLKKHNIRLIHIFEHLWRDRNFQFKSFLRSALGKNENKIGARKCKLKLVDIKESRNFLDQYHIQGKTNNIKLAIGLYNGDDLLALATFGAHHRKGKKIVLNRFVCKENWTVSGALSRLTKYASNYFKEDIVTWADNSISEGNGYLKSGWELEEILKPDYFYTNGKNVFSKQSRKKSIVKTPDGITEHEHALLDGLFKVYDCGKTRFIYKYRK